VARRVVDCPALDERGLRAAEAEIHDPRPMVDRPDDRRRLVEIGEARAAAVRLHDHQRSRAAEARHPGRAANRAGRERGDERPVADAVVDGVGLGGDVVGRRALGGEARHGHVGPGVDDGDRHARRGGLHPRRNEILVCGRPLPLGNRRGRGGRKRRRARIGARLLELHEPDSRARAKLPDGTKARDVNPRRPQRRYAQVDPQPVQRRGRGVAHRHEPARRARSRRTDRRNCRHHAAGAPHSHPYLPRAG
jgi:hypothetical protein